ncbi:MAG: fructosamine kinase family protein [Corynebacterium sp.]|nr:fructosamine kinase family protein [Corynebacterium sp.]
MAWLAEAAPGHVAEVLRVSDTGVTLPEYTTVAPIEGIVRRAGGILARIHQAGAPAFGAPPPGWDCPYYIGSQQQTCRSCESWAQFYVDQRVLPFARCAFNRGNLDIAGLNDVKSACARLIGEDLVPEGAPRADSWGFVERESLVHYRRTDAY